MNLEKRIDIIILQAWMKIIGYETAISDICPWQQRELNELCYGWRSSELCDKISILSFPYQFICLALVAIATAIVAKLPKRQKKC